MSKKPVAVQVGGQRFSVRSEADETYVRRVASFVDQRLEEVRGGRVMPTQQLAVLTALNIADELFRERRALAQLKTSVLSRSKAMLAAIREAERALEGEETTVDAEAVKARRPAG